MVVFPYYMPHAVSYVTEGIRVTMRFNMYEKPAVCSQISQLPGVDLPLPTFDQKTIDSVRALFESKYNIVCSRDSIYASILAQALGPPRKVYCTYLSSQSICYLTYYEGTLSDPIARIGPIVGDIDHDTLTYEFNEWVGRCNDSPYFERTRNPIYVMLLFKANDSDLCEHEKTMTATDLTSDDEFLSDDASSEDSTTYFKPINEPITENDIVAEMSAIPDNDQ